MFRNKYEGHPDRGAAAVEMALVLPLMLLVLFAMIDFGRAFNEVMQLTQAARESARIVALGGTGGDAFSRANKAINPADIPELRPSVTVSVSCPLGDSTSTGKVSVSRVFTYVTPLGPIAGIFVGGGSGLADVGDTKTLSAVGAMRCAG